MQKKEKILITGATGFIGCILTQMLLEQNYDVRCFVRKTSDIDFLKETSAEIVIGDLRDYKSIENAMTGIDTVFHLAAISRPEKLFYFRPNFAKSFNTVNTQGTIWLTDIAIKNNVKKMIFFSSVSASDSWEVAGGISPTAYAKSKKQADNYLQKKAKDSNTDIITISPGQVFGEGSIGIANFYGLIKKGMFVIMGDGNNKIPIAYVKDVAKAAIAAKEFGKNGHNYYIYNEKIIFNNYINKVKKCLKCNAKNIKVPLKLALAIAIIKECFERLFFIKICPFNMDVGINGVKSVAASFTGNNETTTKDLNFTPSTKIEQGIENAVSWCLQKGLIK